MALTTTPYFPTEADVTPEQVQPTRDRLELRVRAALPTVDTRPGSVMGDLVLSPLALLAASMDIASERFASDLDLANVADGNVVNCDMAVILLNNLAVTARDTLKAAGTVTFSFVKTYVDAEILAGRQIVIDANTRLLFGGDQGDQSNIFTPRAPGGIHPVVVASTAYTGNPYVFRDNGEGAYEVDVPVWGSMFSDVEAGAAAELDQVIPGLTSAIALNTFAKGSPPQDVKALAQRARRTVYAASPTTRSGAASFVFNNFAEVTGCSPVVQGDPEMMRDTLNLLGFSDGRALDVYVGGASTAQGKVVVTLPLDETGAGLYRGALPLGNVPVAIDYVRPLNWTGTGVSADGDGDPVYDTGPTAGQKIFTPGGGQSFTISSSTNASVGYAGQVSRSGYEQFYLCVKNPNDLGGVPAPILIPTIVDGVKYGVFEVGFTYDPVVQAVQRVMDTSAFRPAGVRTVVRGFNPVTFTKFDVYYTRAYGKNVNVGQARGEIMKSINATSYPDTFTFSQINDSLLFAGARACAGVDALGWVAASAASHWLVEGGTLPLTDADLTAGLGLAYAAVERLWLTQETLATFTWQSALIESAIGPRNFALSLSETVLNLKQYGGTL